MSCKDFIQVAQNLPGFYYIRKDGKDVKNGLEKEYALPQPPQGGKL